MGDGGRGLAGILAAQARRPSTFIIKSQLPRCLKPVVVAAFEPELEQDDGKKAAEEVRLELEHRDEREEVEPSKTNVGFSAERLWELTARVDRLQQSLQEEEQNAEWLRSRLAEQQETLEYVCRCCLDKLDQQQEKHQHQTRLVQTTFILDPCGTAFVGQDADPDGFGSSVDGFQCLSRCSELFPQELLKAELKLCSRSATYHRRFQVESGTQGDSDEACSSVSEVMALPSSKLLLRRSCWRQGRTIGANLARLRRLASSRARRLRQEHKQRLEAEEKLNCLEAQLNSSPSSITTTSEKASETEPTQIEAVGCQTSGLELAIYDKNRSSKTTSNAGSLARRISQLKGTSERLVNDLQGASILLGSSRVTVEADDRSILELKAKLRCMEKQLLDMEAVALLKTKTLEEQLCTAFEARINALEHQKWALKKRLQVKTVELKHEQVKRQEAEVRVQLECCQRALLETQQQQAATTVEVPGEVQDMASLLRAEVEKISSGIMEAVRRAETVQVRARQAEAEVSEHRDLVWRQGLVALEQALLLCVAAFLVFSRRLYGGLAAT